MEKKQDILLGEDGDLLIKKGDFVIGESLTQEVETILTLVRGNLKSDPILGPDLVRRINGKETGSSISQAIRLSMERDNKYVNNISYKNGNFNIDVE